MGYVKHAIPEVSPILFGTDIFFSLLKYGMLGGNPISKEI